MNGIHCVTCLQITFGRDQTLRIWDVPSALRTECGEINDADNASKDPKEETGEPEGGGGASGSRDSTPTAKKREWNLQGEFQSINLSHFKYLELDSFNSSRRSCYVTASFMGRPRKMYHLALVITFPCGYPDNAAPIFAFSKGNSLETNQKNFILKSLKSTVVYSLLSVVLTSFFLLFIHFNAMDGCWWYISYFLKN